VLALVSELGSRKGALKAFENMRTITAMERRTGNGSRLTGSHALLKMHGKGILVYPNGEKYEVRSCASSRSQALTEYAQKT